MAEKAPEFHGQSADVWAAELDAFWAQDGKVAVNRRALAALLTRIDPDGFLQGEYVLGTAWVDDGSGYARRLVERAACTCGEGEGCSIPGCAGTPVAECCDPSASDVECARCPRVAWFGGPTE